MTQSDTSQAACRRDAAPPRVIEDDGLRFQMWTLKQMPPRDVLYRQRFAVARLKHRPLFSIITPVYRTPPYELRRMLASVKDQTYPHWEHLLIDDGSGEAWLDQVLRSRAASDPRVRYTVRAENGGIVAASNDALRMATGDFVVFLDHDDELTPHALYALACELNAQPDLDLIYSDLDLIGRDGRRYSPMFLPPWSPDLLRFIPYIVHLSAYRRTVVEALGGLRPGLDGAQDYDLALRCTELTQKIAHIPDILYHWREGENSTANNLPAKPYVLEAGRQAFRDHAARTGLQADRTDGIEPGMHRLVFDRFERPPVSVIVAAPASVPDQSPSLFEVLLRSLASIVERTTYPEYEILVTLPADAPATWATQISDCVPGRLRLVTVDASVDPYLARNVAAREAAHDLLAFVRPDLGLLSPGWLSDMQGYARMDGVGVVAPKIFTDDDRIAHAGIVLPRGIPHDVHRGVEATSYGQAAVLVMPQNFQAVSGACMMTRRDDFEAVGGFRDPAVVGYSDVDFCLRLRERGARTVFLPTVTWQYLVPTPPPTADSECERRMAFRRAWPDLPEVDPWYSPHFIQDDGQYILNVS